MSTNAVPANVLADMQGKLDAGEITKAPFDATVEWFTQGKDYEATAKALNITKGRAAEYVRRVLVTSGHGDLTPRGANGQTRSTGGGSVRKVSDAQAQIEALLEQAREQVTNLQQQVTEARAAADGFTPEGWVEAQVTAMEAQVAELQARLAAFTEDTDGAATNAANEEATRLRKRADDVQAEVEQQLTTAEANVGKFEQMVALMAEANEPTG